MVTLHKIANASENVKRRAKTCFVKRLTPNSFRVTPRQYPKSRRLVLFLDDATVLCLDQNTGDSCPANQFGVACAHVYRATQHLVNLNKRRKVA